MVDDRPLGRPKVPADAFQTPHLPSRSTRNLLPPKIHENYASLPLLSPRRRQQKAIFSDRYIPNRTGIDLQAAFSLLNQDVLPDLRSRGLANLTASGDRIDNEIEIRKEEEANRTFSTVLRAELFGDNVPMVTADLQTGRLGSGSAKRPASADSLGDSSRPNTGNNGTNNGANGSSTGLGGSGNASLVNTAIHAGNPNPNAAGPTRTTPPRSTLGQGSHSESASITSTPRQSANLFTYQLPSKTRPISRDIHNELYLLLPVRQELQKLLLSPQKKPRNISKVPYRVLDAPELLDDFYLNLVDWGAQDVLAVGLGDSVYLWDGATQLVDRLCNLENKDKVTSLNWIGLGTHLAIGTLKGLVEIWDATKIKCVRTMLGHSLRVSSLAWNEHILLSGSRDRSILNRDVRIENHYVNKFDAHKQEVCGLRWNVEENKLASGGNDNKLYVWDGLNTKPLHTFSDHTAAVKAIAWSPHQRGVLASGGGTADKTIKTWNTLTGSMIQDVNTGLQVCNLIWLKNSNELVSTHGYLRNQIIVWKYPQIQQIAQLTGHTYRVLYLLLSPDGETIVTGAGDETLRFWNVFEKNKHDEPPSLVLLDAFLQLR